MFSLRRKSKIACGASGSAQVGGEDLDASDVEFAFELTGGGFERIALAGDEDEVESVAGKNFGNLEADSAGAAGDQRSQALGAVSFWTHGLNVSDS